MSAPLCIVCHEKCRFWERYVRAIGTDVAAHHSCLRFYLATVILLGTLPDPDKVAKDGEETLVTKFKSKEKS